MLFENFVEGRGREQEWQRVEGAKSREWQRAGVAESGGCREEE